MSERTYSEVMDDFRHHIAVDESVATDPEDIFAIEARINKGLADRLEAAHKRERGDCAKLREAAEVTLTTIKKCMDILNSIPSDCGYDGLVEDVGDELCGLRDDFINAALAAPARNCDKYPTFNDAIRALADKRGWHDAKWDSERYCILAQWLYALATEREGGNDAD